MWTADEDVNMKAIFAVMNTTWAVMKIRPEKIQACTGFESMTFATPVQCSTNWLTSQLEAGHYVGSEKPVKR